MKKKVTRPVATPTSKLSKGDHSRERLVDAAIKIFAREGLGNASFQQIADAAGLKQSSLFYYFANKDELVNGVIQTVIRRSQTFVDSRISIRDDAFKKLHKYFQFMMAWANEYPHEGEVLFLLYYYAAMQKPFSVFYSQVVTTARNRILEMLLSGGRENLFPLPLGPELTATLLHDSVLGGVLNACSLRRAGPSWAETGEKWGPLIRQLTGMVPSKS